MAPPQIARVAFFLANIYIFPDGVIVIFLIWSKLRGHQYFLHQSYLVKYFSWNMHFGENEIYILYINIYFCIFMTPHAYVMLEHIFLL